MFGKEYHNRDVANKAKLTNAIKNINASFSSRQIQLAENDVSALPDGFDAKNPDTLVLSSALKLKADGQTHVLLTSDAMLQSKATALSVAAVSFRDFLLVLSRKMLYEKCGTPHHCDSSIQM